MSFYAVAKKRNDGMLSAFNISINEAFQSFPSDAYASTFKEALGVLKRTFSALDWRRLSSLQRRKAIPCKLFLKAKFHPHTGDFLKLNARLVGCQLKSRADPENADIPSSPTMSSTGFPHSPH